MSAESDQIGREFVRVYYETFDSNRANLVSLYTTVSVMSFEGQQFQGAEAIVKKLSELPFQRIQHVVTTIDCQPTIDQSIVVHVVGQLKTDEDRPHSFSQTFLLKQTPGGPFYVLNDVFRLALHNG